MARGYSDFRYESDEKDTAWIKRRSTRIMAQAQDYDTEIELFPQGPSSGTGV
jgi:hypothetical protein